MSKLPKHSFLKTNRQIKKAKHHFEFGEYQLALGLCMEILQALPRHDEASHLAGASLLRMGNVASAMPLLGGALQSNPASTIYQQTYLDGLVALFHQKHYDLLVSSATFFTDLVPLSGQGLHMLGVGLAHQHLYEQAKLALLGAKRLLPANPYVLCSLGNALNDLHLID